MRSRNVRAWNGPERRGKKISVGGSNYRATAVNVLQRVTRCSSVRACVHISEL